LISSPKKGVVSIIPRSARAAASIFQHTLFPPVNKVKGRNKEI
jgi:hypothetical protein